LRHAVGRVAELGREQRLNLDRRELYARAMEMKK